MSGTTTEELRAIQEPLKRRYRDEPAAALVTLKADGSLDDGVACTVNTGRGGSVHAEGDLDFRGTLSVDKEAPVGFTAIRLNFTLQTEADEDQLATLLRLTERYCVVFQTLAGSPALSVTRSPAD